jgi:Ribonuclease G/E
MPSYAELQVAAEVIERCRAPKPRLPDVVGKTCPRCNGKGVITDDAQTGRRMRTLRESKKISAREVARRTGFSAAYICDLELGRRIWNTKVTELYLEALR